LPEENFACGNSATPAARLPRDDEETARGVPAAAPAATSSEPALDDGRKNLSPSRSRTSISSPATALRRKHWIAGSHSARAPRHTPTLEKLLDFVLGAATTAARRTAAQLEQIHGETATSAAPNVRRIAPPLPACRWFERRGMAIAVPPAKPAARRSLSQSRWMCDSRDRRGTCAASAHASSGAVKPPRSRKRPLRCRRNRRSCASGSAEVDLSDEWATLIEETQPSDSLCSSAPVQRSRGHAGASDETADVEEFQIGEEPAIVPADGAPAITSFELATHLRSSAQGGTRPRKGRQNRATQA